MKPVIAWLGFVFRTILRRIAARGRMPRASGPAPQGIGTSRQARGLLSALLCAGLLVGCAADPVAFVPPAQRPVAAIDQPWPSNHVLTLAYHDIEDTNPDQRFLAVRTDQLVAQLEWLRVNGYQAVSVDQILAAHDGGPELPAKAVLLSFDDGYSSFVTRVFPILQAMGWPAVWAPVGAWLDTPADQPVNFGGVPVPRERFATWDQVRQVARSGLVEIASHTDDLHRGVLGNPQGNLEPAAATRIYDPATRSYENDTAFQTRIAADARAIGAKIRRASGKAPRVWVWPYGAASGAALDVLARQGYRMALTLEDGLGSVNGLMAMPRLLVANLPDASTFARAVLATEAPPVMRAAQVDLDYVYDEDPAQVDRNLGALVQRIADMKINTVFLQAFADPTGDGLARSTYFPNDQLPVRADLFNRVVWQLRTRASVEVYAWMPVLSFDLPPGLSRVLSAAPPAQGNEDAATDTPARAAPAADPERYRRLSPFDPAARRAIIRLYEAMARSAPIDGILFHDDALLGDYEDASPAALAAYRAAGLPGSIHALRADPQTFARWTRFKSRALIDFTRTLTEHVRAIRGPQVKTARNLYAMPVLDPDSEAWFAQDLDDFLRAYDWTALMAMPRMESVPRAEELSWLDHLAGLVKEHPDGIEKTVFTLQTRDWSRPGEPDIPDATLTRWIQRLQMDGVRSFAWYPDDFVRNQPPLDVIRPALSTNWYPQP